MKKIAVILAEGFEDVEAVTPVDFMRRAGIEVFVAGLTQNKVSSSHGLVIETDCLLSDLPENLDGIVIPGGMPGSSHIASSEEACSLIRKYWNQEKLIAAICAAPAVVLGSMGLLSGKKFTGYPGSETGVKGGIHTAGAVVTDGNLITSRGAGTAAQFSIEIINYLVSNEKADEIKKATLQSF